MEDWESAQLQISKVNLTCLCIEHELGLGIKGGERAKLLLSFQDIGRDGL